jgi:hypothetical protein
MVSKPKVDKMWRLARTSLDVPKLIVSLQTDRLTPRSKSVWNWSSNISKETWLSHTPDLTASTHMSEGYIVTTTCDNDMTACCKHVDRRPQPELVQRACCIWKEASGDALGWNIYVANGFHDLINKRPKFKSFMPLTQDQLVCRQYLRGFCSCLHYYTHNQCETAIASAECLAPYKIYKLEVGHEMEILENAYAKTCHLNRFFEQDPLRICQGKIVGFHHC